MGIFYHFQETPSFSPLVKKYLPPAPDINNDIGVNTFDEFCDPTLAGIISGPALFRVHSLVLEHPKL